MSWIRRLLSTTQSTGKNNRREEEISFYRQDFTPAPSHQYGDKILRVTNVFRILEEGIIPIHTDKTFFLSEYMKCHIFERWDELCIPTCSTLEIFTNSPTFQS